MNRETFRHIVVEMRRRRHNGRPVASALFARYVEPHVLGVVHRSWLLNKPFDFSRGPHCDLHIHWVVNRPAGFFL